MTNFLDSQFSKTSSSRKGLALALDQFLCDNPRVGFTATDLGARFGVEPSKIRGIMRDVNGRGTRSKGNMYANSADKDSMLYILPFEGEGSNFQYVACNWKQDPRTGNQYPVNPRTGKAWASKSKAKSKAGK